MSPAPDTRQFTGLHMLGIMLAFFGVIIAVNLTMAFFANSSWTGLVVQNSYVASQEFNEKARQARAQAGLGWQARVDIGRGRVSLALTDANGRPVALAGGVATFRRPLVAAEDQTINLAPLPDGSAGAPQTLSDGAWVAEFLVDAGLDHPYREVRRLVLHDGAVQ